MEPGEGWTIDKQLKWFLRVKAWLALRAYRRAERPYRRLTLQLDALEAEREALLQTMIADHRAGRLERHDIERHAAELMQINVRFAELTEPWRQADAAMRSACVATRKVLSDIGFREYQDQSAGRDVEPLSN